MTIQECEEAAAELSLDATIKKLGGPAKLAEQGIDGFEVAQALYWFLAMNYEGQWSPEYRALCQLGYTPAPNERVVPPGNPRLVYRILCQQAGLEDHLR